MPNNPSVPKPQHPRAEPGDDSARQPATPDAGAKAEDDAAKDDDDNPLESLGKAVAEPVLGADRTTTGDRVRDKLDRPEGSGRR